MIGRACFAFSLLLPVLIGAGSLQAETCTSADFGAVVDQTAKAMRELNGAGSRRYQARIAALREKQGLSQADIEARTTGLHDEKIDGFNRDIESLVAQMDVLSQTPEGKITCDKLDELKRARDRLLEIMAQKSTYMVAKIDEELDRPANARSAAAANPASAPTPAAPVFPQTNSAAKSAMANQPPTAAAAPMTPVVPPAVAAAPTTSTAPTATAGPAISMAPPAPQATAANPSWQTDPSAAPASIKPPSMAETRPLAAESKPSVVASARPTTPPVPDYAPPALPERSPGAPSRVARNTTPTDRDPPPPAPMNDADRPTALAPPPYRDGAAPVPPPANGEQQDGYSIAEIREAGRGIFGTITAEFGGAINYAFQQFGQPNAYISGVEGGAAFLAGLRYGKGTFHRKAEGPREIFWQGPSAGLDFGAEGGRALFLVYNLEDPYAIYGRFGGIGGAAYVAGGVGLTVLGKSGMILVPIRSGLGLRLGANLAYVKFTERQTWNPF
jgi:hypothetical protein